MKIRIKIGVIGYLPFEFNRKLIKEWKSEIFEIVDDIEDFHFKNDADSLDWSFSDNLLSQELPAKYDGDFFIGITYVPIEDNFYCRRLENNRVIISYFQIHNFLRAENIPVENFLLRTLYASCLVFLRNEQTIPKTIEWIGYTHDDTRGCLFDMNGIKSDVIYSLDPPIICDDCINRIRQNKVPDKTITQIKKEISHIRKAKYYRINRFVKRKPLLSIAISGAFGILISLTASIIYGSLFNPQKNYENQNIIQDSIKVDKSRVPYKFGDSVSIRK